MPVGCIQAQRLRLLTEAGDGHNNEKYFEPDSRWRRGTQGLIPSWAKGRA
jgi:hypothetical protein